MLRTSDGELPARCGRALGSSLKVLCCGWTECRDSQNSSGRPECSFAKTSSDLPSASLPVAALGAFPCTRLLPLRHRAALWGSLFHTCAPLLVQMLWIGQCPRPLPPEPASLVCLRPVEIFQLCAHWKCLPGFFTCLLFLLGQSLSTCHSHCRWRPAIS